MISILQNETMDKNQYQCIKAAHNEVEAYERDGYVVTLRCSAVNGWWVRFMRHPNGKSIFVVMNNTRNELRVFVNGVLKKCQKFDA